MPYGFDNGYAAEFGLDRGSSLDDLARANSWQRVELESLTTPNYPSNHATVSYVRKPEADKFEVLGIGISRLKARTEVNAYHGLISQAEIDRYLDFCKRYYADNYYDPPFGRDSTNTAANCFSDHFDRIGPDCTVDAKMRKLAEGGHGKEDLVLDLRQFASAALSSPGKLKQLYAAEERSAEPRMESLGERMARKQVEASNRNEHSSNDKLETARNGFGR